MIPDGKAEPIVEQLRALAATDRLPLQAGRAVKQLVERLSSPVRIALMGPKGGGKSMVGNMLAGATVLPDGMALPSSELRFAPQPGLVVTLGDGTHGDVPAFDFHAALALAPAFIKVRAPLPMLRKINILETVTDGSALQLIAAAKWASRRTDMAIWVTPEFDGGQQALWRSMPDAMKDHAFLVLSKNDINPAGRHGQALGDRAEDGFIAVIPVAAKQAMVSVDSQMINGGDVWGCKTLTDEVTRRVDIGRQADLDAARLFLKRFTSADDPAPKPRQPAEPERRGVPLMAADNGNTAETLAPSELTLATALSGFETLADGAVDNGAEAALTLIRAKAETLLQEVSQADDLPADRILMHCAETFDSLEEVIADDTEIYDLVLQAADFVVLLQLEKGEQAAQDAVVALLQLKRDFEQALAA